MMLHSGTHFLRHIHSSYIPLSNRYHHLLTYTYTVVFSNHHNKTAHHTLWNTVQASTRRFFLPTKHYTVLQYKHKYNFIYSHKKSLAFPALIS